MVSYVVGDFVGEDSSEFTVVGTEREDTRKDENFTTLLLLARIFTS
jgi:hypothetical protein